MYNKFPTPSVGFLPGMFNFSQPTYGQGMGVPRPGFAMGFNANANPSTYGGNYVVGQAVPHGVAGYSISPQTMFYPSNPPSNSTVCGCPCNMRRDNEWQ